MAVGLVLGSGGRVPRLRCDRLSLECDRRKALFVGALRAGLRIREACVVAGWRGRGCYSSARARDRVFAREADEAKLVGWGVRFDRLEAEGRLLERDAVADPVPRFTVRSR